MQYPSPHAAPGEVLGVNMLLVFQYYSFSSHILLHTYLIIYLLPTSLGNLLRNHLGEDPTIHEVGHQGNLPGNHPESRRRTRAPCLKFLLEDHPRENHTRQQNSYNLEVVKSSQPLTKR